MKNEIATPEAVAAAFRQYLKSKGYTFKHAAEVAGVTPSALSMQLKGRYMPYKSARAFAKAFGLSVDYLLEGVGPLVSPKEISTLKDLAAISADSEGDIKVNYNKVQRPPILPKENLGEVMHELQLVELLVRELSLKVDRLQRDIDYLKTTPIGD